ncbi:MAG: TrkA family potassium uptake protein [Erysipelotrichaceae bacterium]|nr:TrkA family potassium uptake protein [Erysipelotrichaceae bacterium]
MKALVIGGGKVGYFLVKTLLEHNTKVTLIEKDRDRAELISKELNIEVLCGDGSDISILTDAGIQNSEIVAAVTGNDEENLVICQIVKVSFGKSKTIARINNPKNIKMFNQLGVDKTVCSTEVIASMINNEMNSDNVKIIQTFDKGNMVLAEVFIRAKNSWGNQFIRDIKLPGNLVVISVIRKDEVIYAKGDTKILKDDIVMVVGNHEAVDHLKAHL